MRKNLNHVKIYGKFTIMQFMLLISAATTIATLVLKTM